MIDALLTWPVETVEIWIAGHDMSEYGERIAAALADWSPRIFSRIAICFAPPRDMAGSSTLVSCPYRLLFRIAPSIRRRMTMGFALSLAIEFVKESGSTPYFLIR
ncbi:hypothetical protein WS70_27880 [Burkholderia mayonis]|uniref:Uncharacterized protein n=2 Tax=Burkholderiaceae TaxID=119060 RepID=A0A1B4FPA1_9BURK|nr:hypothetical protein WS70_27880 [Burkholderia mayonis]KVE41052.1 hypothetical protein WS69_05805 [Burkholderia sp. BDU5]KVE47789.1 hypothetical protein WS70_24880 [Burkholderia mayonis]